ncbi:WD40/YVTN/BNR-like repeat-containing protein [Castellaniella defragrans]|uniref:Photosystem II stability/assembly factor-like uncharacterized protein n=1 Tax=Castellaniella defragrans TaxID=75697 RepID=A0A7W9WME0_CASDE|nr:YCF48-related protein [Castellaniella defragrans]KAB0622266.1 hypothetical protein F7Q88_04185 [Castellaniella defragrans]MBB6084202.1 photosystem II stability/assembly factor-like uncharacterized protein [Castellaniella defragrans]
MKSGIFRGRRPAALIAAGAAGRRVLPGLILMGAAIFGLAAPGASRAMPEADERPALRVEHPERAALQAIARAGSRVVAVGERGLILWSDDAGRSWRQAQVPVSVTLTAVTFPTPQEGWAVGHFGTVLHTRDGGQTWERQLDGRTAAQRMLDAALALDAASEGAARHLAAARRMVADGPDKPFLDVYFSDARHGLVVGAYNLILRTVDGGRSWHSLAAQVENPMALHLYAIQSTSEGLYLAGEQGLVLLSRDGGAHFRQVTTPYQGSYFTLRASPRGDLVVAGLRGRAFRRPAGGERWEPVPVPEHASVIASALDDHGRLLLATQSGQVYASTDMGRSLSALDAVRLPQVTSLTLLPEGILLATTLQGIVRKSAESLILRD